MFLQPIVLIPMILSGLGGSQESPTTKAQIPPPVQDGQPVDVRVGFLVLEFSRIDSRAETFGITAHVSLAWDDPRLALADGETSDGPRRFRSSTIWTPPLFFPNALNEAYWQVQEADVEVSPAGAVRWSGVLSGQFAFVMHLQRFPFDQQILPVRIGTYASTREVRLIPEASWIGRAPQVSLSDWDVGVTTAYNAIYEYPPSGSSYSYVMAETIVDRRSTFYTWRVMVPISLLVMASWMVFWFEPINLQPQISTSLGLLISLVTFHFGVDFALPKVTYLSLVEKHAIYGLIFVLGSAVGVTAVHRLVVTERIALALRLQRKARWLMPPAYAVSVIVEFAFSFGPGQ